MRWLEYLLFLGLVLGLARPLGHYLARVFSDEPTLLDPVLRPVEGALLTVFGVKRGDEMSAGVYTLSFALFSLVGTVGLFMLLLVQRSLPGGPADAFLTTPMSVDLAANTAISFATTTTWQAYAGETTLRYLTQAIGLVSQNFLAGAAGLAVGIAFIRGFARERSTHLGNFWVDLIRALLWVLLPASLLGAAVLVFQGVPMNLSAYARAHTLEGGLQTIPQGPVAALEFIKNLGTNGGGFFNANGAHPYENPTPLTNFLGMLAIAAIPAALPVTFGRMTGRPGAGRLLLAVMGVLFVGGLIVCDRAESGIPQSLGALHVFGGGMEGKEARFGVGDSVLTALVTSNGATGSYNAMVDSYQPVGALVLLVNMMIGDVVFGGLGTGLYGMVMIALVASFLGGLMVGRTPAYLGKALGPDEVKLVALYAIVTPAAVLLLSALAVSTNAGRAGITTNPGSHGLTEILFAFASATANNGQTMASLNADSPFYNATTAIAMLVGRFGLTALALALAGRFASQGRLENNAGTLSSESATFFGLVLATIVIFGALSFFPALALGPIKEAYRS